jgi:hypothetical protein
VPSAARHARLTSRSTTPTARASWPGTTSVGFTVGRTRVEVVRPLHPTIMCLTASGKPRRRNPLLGPRGSPTPSLVQKFFANEGGWPDSAGTVEGRWRRAARPNPKATSRMAGRNPAAATNAACSRKVSNEGPMKQPIAAVPKMAASARHSPAHAAQRNSRNRIRPDSRKARTLSAGRRP